MNQQTKTAHTVGGRLRILIGLITINLVTLVAAYPQIRDRFAADVTVMAGLPYSLFLEDYYDAGRDQLVANILFNDFNEAFWTFKLSMRIESADIRIRTRPGFMPLTPITVSPGIPYRFTGHEWTDYFERNNLIIEGPGKQTLDRLGRLPEGFYTVYLQVLDYETGEPLSEEMFTSFYATLQNPPIVNLPEPDAIVTPGVVQFQFAWQLFNNPSPNLGFATQYQLTIWDQTDLTANPLTAVANGQALQIFQTEPLTATTYLYGLADPILEAGRSYLYRVQALDPGGRDQFKNQGFSEFRRFFYGYPTGNVIDLVYPEYEGGFRKDDVRTLQWLPIESRVPGQWVTYQVQVAEMREGETAEQALRSRTTYANEFYTNRTYTLGISISDMIVKSETPYAWQVTGYSEGLEVGKSEPSIFYGPPLFDNIYSGRHRIAIDYVNGPLDNLSGGGKVRLTEDPRAWTEVEFESITLENRGGYYYIASGEIIHELDEPRIFSLSPDIPENPETQFVMTKARLNKDGLGIYGYAKMDLPFPSFSTEKATVVSQGTWIPFDYFDLVGSVNLAQDQTYELLEPHGFTLAFDPNSKIRINQDTYRMELVGSVTLPEMVTSLSGEQLITLPFSNQSRMDYLAVLQAANLSPIALIDNTELAVVPNAYIIDLSEGRSPPLFSNEPGWKGVYFNTYNLQLPNRADGNDRLVLGEDLSLEISQVNDKQYAFVTRTGLHLAHAADLSNLTDATINTFSTSLNEINLKVSDHRVEAGSKVTGSFLIPLLSIEERFDFEMPITDQGFLDGVVYGLTDRSFVHNPDVQEQQLDIIVRRAVFEEKERLSLTVEVVWPSLGLDLKGLRNLKVWGDHNVGFYKPEGVFALDYQVSSEFNGYPITIDAIAAGRSDGHYGFGLSGKVILGEDVSGNEGAPNFNFYSMAQNELLPGDYEPVSTSDQSIADADPKASLEQITSEMANMEESLLADLEATTDALTGQVEGELSSAAAQLAGPALTVNELITEGDEPKKDFDWEDAQVILETVPEVLDGIKAFLPEGEYEGIRSTIDFIGKLRPSEQARAYRKLAALPQDLTLRFVEDINEKALAPIERELNRVNGNVVGRINDLTTNVNGDVANIVSDIVDRAAGEVASTLGQQNPEAAALVAQVAENTKRAILMEVQGAISLSVRENITDPLSSLIQDAVLLRMELYLQNSAQNAVVATFTSGASPTDALGTAVTGLDDEFAAMGEEVMSFFKPASVSERIRSLASDAINNIDGQRIVLRIKQGATDALVNFVAKKTAEKVDQALNKALSDDIGIEAPIDLGGATSKLITGGNFKDVLSDPVIIKVRSKAMDLNGQVFFTEDHPVYGDIWSGAVEVQVKVPQPFMVQAAYMNGRKEGMSYWFAELGGAGGQVTNTATGAPEGINEVGGDMSSDMAPPSGGINLGVAKIMALRGRVYHHMQADALGEIVPDPSQQFGAYLHMVLFGPKDGDQLRLEVEAEMNTFTNGDLTVDFRGNIQIDNIDPKVLIPDPNAAIQGAIELRYNSAERHFFGYATVTLRKSAICADGSLLVDVKPEAWRIALGTRDERLGFVPACAGPAFYGWLDLNQSTAELGLGLGLALYVSAGFNVGVAKLDVIVDAGINANVFVVAEYKPLSIDEVGVFVEVWARLLIAYQIAVKKGTIELLDIYLYASAIMRFDPAPSVLYGELRGHVRLLSILKFDFDKDFELEV